MTAVTTTAPGADHARIFEEQRSLLFGLAYRMLGSAMDAEDLVQESFLSFQKTELADLREPRALLTTILTRRVIDYLKSARVRREQYVGPWLPEPLLADEDFDPAGRLERDETVSTAFLLMLDTLSPVERAVYLLRDVFDFDYGQIAGIVERSAETCRRTASRARERLREEQERRPRFEMTVEKKERLLERFMAACRGGDLEDLIGLLAADARLYSDGGGKIVAALNPIFGSINLARFLLGVIRKSPPRVPLRIKIAGEPALAMFGLDGRLDSVSTFDWNGECFENVYILRNPEKLERIAGELRPGRLRLWYYRLLVRIGSWWPGNGFS